MNAPTSLRVEPVTMEARDGKARRPGVGPEVLGAQGVSKRFRERDAVQSVNLSIMRGERIVIVGRSGSGKSTFLRCLNLLETPTAGEVRYEREVIGSWGPRRDKHTMPTRSELKRHRMRVGMVFQHFELFPHLTAIQNVTLGLRRTLKKGKREADEIASRYLVDVGLGHRMSAHPHELSGGEQQRVAIARSLAMEPAVILFDEPTSALDAELVGEVLEVMVKLAEEGMTMVVVTHEMAFARDVATRLVVFSDGTIAEEGPPEAVIDNPKTAATERLLKNLRLR